MVLSTVREVGHYSCRSMTGNCARWRRWRMNRVTRRSTPPMPNGSVLKMKRWWVNSRKGRIITRAQVSDRPNKGAVYMTYQWWIGACNELVTENLSPITKTPSINTAP